MLSILSLAVVAILVMPMRNVLGRVAVCGCLNPTSSRADIIIDFQIQYEYFCYFKSNLPVCPVFARGCSHPQKPDSPSQHPNDCQ